MDTPMVWIISPDPDTRRLIGLNLSKRGFRVLETSSQDGLALPREKPQLIILDVEPPDESGWQTARTLRRSFWTQAVPLILLLSSAPAPSRLVPFQPVRWLEKPLAIDALLSLVRESLGQWERPGHEL
jgi:DNA-binding response OmpR family regulator